MKKLISTIWTVFYAQFIYGTVSVIVQLAFLGALFIYEFFTGKIDAFDYFKNNIMLLTGLAALVAIPILSYFYIRNKNNEIKKQSLKSPSFATYVTCILGAAGAAVVCNLITAAIFTGFNDAAFDEVNEIIYNSSLITAILAGVILGPIAEELVFRGIIYRKIAYNYNPIAAIIITSIAFGIFHGNITQGVYAFLMGLMLAYAYFVTDRILVCMLMHIAANLISFVASDILDGGNLFAIVICVIVIVICVINIGFMIRMLIKHYKNSRKEIKEYETT